MTARPALHRDTASARSDSDQYRAMARTGVDPIAEGMEDEVVARVVASDLHRRVADRRGTPWLRWRPG